MCQTTEIEPCTSFQEGYSTVWLINIHISQIRFEEKSVFESNANIQIYILKTITTQWAAASLVLCVGINL